MQGITSHVDLARFEDGIAIVSLGREEVMEFQPARAEPDSAEEPVEQPNGAEAPKERQSKRVKYFRGTESEFRADEVGRDFAEGYHIDNKPSVGCAVERVVSNETPISGPNRFAESDGNLGSKAGCSDKQCSTEGPGAPLLLNDNDVRTAKNSRVKREVIGRTSKTVAQAAERHKISGSSKDGVRRLVLLPGSLLLMSGEARYGWKHGIPGRTEHDKSLQTSNGVRISVTLRRLCRTS